MSQSSFVCTQLNSFKYSKWLNSFFLSLDGTLTGSSTSDQGGPESNSNKGVHHILWSSRAGTLPSDGLMSYPGHSLEVLHLCRDAVSIFFSPRQMDCKILIKEIRLKGFNLANKANSSPRLILLGKGMKLYPALCMG